MKGSQANTCSPMSGQQGVLCQSRGAFFQLQISTPEHSRSGCTQQNEKNKKTKQKTLRWCNVAVRHSFLFLPLIAYLAPLTTDCTIFIRQKFSFERFLKHSHYNPCMCICKCFIQQIRVNWINSFSFFWKRLYSVSSILRHHCLPSMHQAPQVAQAAQKQCWIAVVGRQQNVRCAWNAAWCECAVISAAGVFWQHTSISTGPFLKPRHLARPEEEARKKTKSKITVPSILQSIFTELLELKWSS